MDIRTVLAYLDTIATELGNKGLEQESIVVDNIFRKIAIDKSDIGYEYKPENFYDEDAKLTSLNDFIRTEDQGGLPNSEFDLKELNDGVKQEIDRSKYDSYVNGNGSDNIVQTPDGIAQSSYDSELNSIGGELSSDKLKKAFEAFGINDTIVNEYSDLANIIHKWKKRPDNDFEYDFVVANKFKTFSKLLDQFAYSQDAMRLYRKESDQVRKIARWMRNVYMELKNNAEQQR